MLLHGDPFRQQVEVRDIETFVSLFNFSSNLFKGVTELQNSFLCLILNELLSWVSPQVDLQMIRQ